jgi:hypothetical protein
MRCDETCENLGEFSQQIPFGLGFIDFFLKKILFEFL